MRLKKIPNGKEILVIFEDEFTFGDREKFREVAFYYTKENVKNIVIDLCNLTYMDSSAIGMLLIFHEKAVQQGVEIKAINISGIIRSLFEQSALGKLFSAEYKE
jgi:anti-anti-sigma factor